MQLLEQLGMSETLHLEVTPEVVESQPESLELSLRVHARRQGTPLPHLHTHRAPSAQSLHMLAITLMQSPC